MSAWGLAQLNFVTVAFLNSVILSSYAALPWCASTRPLTPIKTLRLNADVTSSLPFIIDLVLEGFAQRIRVVTPRQAPGVSHEIAHHGEGEIRVSRGGSDSSSGSTAPRWFRSCRGAGSSDRDRSPSSRR